MTFPALPDATVPAPQSLTMLNGRWTVEESKRLAAAVSKDSKDEAIVTQVWRRVLVRDPDTEELDRARKFLRDQAAELGTLPDAASELARALFNTNEFLYVD